MRTRTTIIASLAASLGLLLGACTSDTTDPAGQGSAGSAGTEAGDTGGTEDDDVEQAGSTAAPVRGFVCRYLAPAQQEQVAGRELTDPYQLIVANDPDSWVCEARDGDEALVRVSILRGAEAWSEQRTLAQEQEGVTEGPEWLGESYRSPRRLTGLTMCSGVVDGEVTHEPYALVVEAVNDADEDVSEALSAAASTLARSLDQAMGCSPRMARGEVPGPTPAS